MISDVSYRSRDTPCDQGRTRGRANDQKRATHAYLVPQSSPVWQAITAQPAAARPEPPLRVAGSPRSCSACARPARWCPRAAQAAGLRSGPAGCGKRRVFAGGPARAAPLGWAIGGGQHARERADRCMDRERWQRPGAREGCASSSSSCHAPSKAAKKRSSLTMMVGVLEVVRGSCPGTSGQLPSEEPLTGPTGSSKWQHAKSESRNSVASETSGAFEKLCNISCQRPSIGGHVRHPLASCGERQQLPEHCHLPPRVHRRPWMVSLALRICLRAPHAGHGWHLKYLSLDMPRKSWARV